MSDGDAAAADHAAALRAWRERGADRVDPVRFGFIEGLVRRAAAQSGAARILLDEKIAGLMVSYAEAMSRVPAAAPAPVQAPSPSLARASAPASTPTHGPAPARIPTPTRAAPTRTLTPTQARTPAPALTRPAAPRGALGALVDLLNQRAPASTPTAAPSPAASSPSATFPGELKALDAVRNTWARLDAEQRLEQAIAQVPANAGPLNSYQLVLRTLTLMRDVSPEYLQRFMSYTDALMWLERAAP